MDRVKLTINISISKVNFTKKTPKNLPENSIFSQIEAFRKNKHSHMFDIGVYATYEHCFFDNNEELGKKGIRGLPPSRYRWFSTPVSYEKTGTAEQSYR